eukprot:TRINITY_DN11182_c0_g2_i3.p1 TRINITY_DN11182_c0_g2~~TRINITY_DN11182_c0_g2_i3.p1  ORF type:complete len:318 (+),score=75.56 TRINITY_DN11182_c0_g2_i3:76-1029(+)
MVQEVIITTAAVILGISTLYYLLLRLAQNAWVGDIPPGPTSYPGIGCLLLYLKIPELVHQIEKYFIVYGNIFTMKCGRQKVVFTLGNESLMKATKEKQIENTTIRDFSKVFSAVNTTLKSQEVVYLQNIWDASFLEMLKVREDDAALMRLIADKICQEDEKIALENGLLTASPSSKDLLKSKNDANIILEDGLEPEVLENLSDILKQRPLHWRGLFFKYFGGWRQNKLARVEIQEKIEEIQEYLNTSSQTLNIQTEKRFLLILYLLVKLSKLQHFSAQKSDLQLGPDVCGWRTFTCQEYADIQKYKVPKYTLIVAKI